VASRFINEILYKSQVCRTSHPCIAQLLNLPMLHLFNLSLSRFEPRVSVLATYKPLSFNGRTASLCKEWPENVLYKEKGYGKVTSTLHALFSMAMAAVII
jgi:hypothetical protein